jgi:predicted nucleotidyltransferase
MGSISHGTYIENSIDDKDVMGVVMLPKEYIFGLKEFSKRGTMTLKKKYWDVVIYDIRKYMSLLIKNNPNVLGLLWLDEGMYIRKTSIGDHLINHRDLFLSKLAYNSFCGYAYSQLMKMEKRQFAGYMGDKRKKIVDEIGYDTKNASHLIRLLRMGIELLESGRINVRRKDASQLLEIKRGEWKLEQVQGEADSLFRKLTAAKDKCALPDRPDHEKINKLLIDIHEFFYDSD